MRPVVKGSTDQSVVIRIIDSADGTPENGVEHNTSGIDLWYRREGGLKVSITEAALTALDDAHSDGGIELIGNGYYRLDLPDAAFATGANGVAVGGTVTGMIVIGCYVPLIDPVLNSAAVAALNDTSGQIISGTVDTVTNTHTPTVTEFQADDITEATADHYNKRAVLWLTGNLAGQIAPIVSYELVGGIGQFTVLPMTEAPANNDAFRIV